MLIEHFLVVLNVICNCFYSLRWLSLRNLRQYRYGFCKAFFSGARAERANARHVLRRTGRGEQGRESGSSIFNGYVSPAGALWQRQFPFRQFVKLSPFQRHESDVATRLENERCAGTGEGPDPSRSLGREKDKAPRQRAGGKRCPLCARPPAAAARLGTLPSVHLPAAMPPPAARSRCPARPRLPRRRGLAAARHPSTAAQSQRRRAGGAAPGMAPPRRPTGRPPGSAGLGWARLPSAAPLAPPPRSRAGRRLRALLAAPCGHLAP